MCTSHWHSHCSQSWGRLSHYLLWSNSGTLCSQTWLWLLECMPHWLHKKSLWKHRTEFWQWFQTRSIQFRLGNQLFWTSTQSCLSIWRPQSWNCHPPPDINRLFMWDSNWFCRRQCRKWWDRNSTSQRLRSLKQWSGKSQEMMGYREPCLQEANPSWCLTNWKLY